MGRASRGDDGEGQREGPRTGTNARTKFGVLFEPEGAQEDRRTLGGVQRLARIPQISEKDVGECAARSLDDGMAAQPQALGGVASEGDGLKLDHERDTAES